MRPGVASADSTATWSPAKGWVVKSRAVWPLPERVRALTRELQPAEKAK